MSTKLKPAPFLFPYMQPLHPFHPPFFIQSPFLFTSAPDKPSVRLVTQILFLEGNPSPGPVSPFRSGLGLVFPFFPPVFTLNRTFVCRPFFPKKMPPGITPLRISWHVHLCLGRFSSRVFYPRTPFHPPPPPSLMFPHISFLPNFFFCF